MDELLSLALIGTAKHPGSGANGDQPIEQLMQNLETLSPERTLLLKAGARAVYRTAGRLTTPAPMTPAPAATESTAICSAKAAGLLEEFFGREPVALRFEAIRRLTKAGLRLPPELLPFALSERHAGVRQALPPVLGHLGVWLCQFNADWQWLPDLLVPEQAAADWETIWSEGSLDQRRAILAKVRARQPELGRAWIEKAWPKEKAEARARLIETLGIGLSAGDEPFLESCSADRSQRVRVEAAMLLARLPESASCVRARDRAAAMLSYSPPSETTRAKKLDTSLAGVEKDLGKLSVMPPLTFDKAWERDGLEEKPPEGKGNRAYWLELAMARVSPTHWEERFGRSQHDLVALASGTEFAEGLLAGWTRAACFFRAHHWVPYLWDYWIAHRPKKETGYSRGQWIAWLVGFMELMPEVELEAKIVPLLVDGDADFLSAFVTFTAARQAAWSTEIGTTYLNLLRRMAAAASGKSYAEASPWFESLDVAAIAVPEACFEQALAQWPLPEEADHILSLWRKKIINFVEIIAARKSFCEQVPRTNAEEMPRGKK